MKSKFIAVITARKGSVRLPSKNKKLLCGKPLIIYTMEEALKSSYIDEIIVTTDDEDIKHLCKGFNIKIIDRPRELAEDDVEAEYPAIHAVSEYDDPVIVLLQPTSPLRTVEHIDNCIEMYINNNFESVISVKEIAPYMYYPNGAVYVFKRQLRENKMGLYVMDSKSSIDIDTIQDFRYAEMILNDDS